VSLKLACRLRAGHYQPVRVVHNDITRGRESHAIMAVNKVDDEDLPTDFVYVADYVETSSVPVNRVITSLQVYDMTHTHTHTRLTARFPGLPG